MGVTPSFFIGEKLEEYDYEKVVAQVNSPNQRAARARLQLRLGPVSRQVDNKIWSLPTPITREKEQE